MKFRRSDADPCIYYRWSKENGLIVWLSWIDDCLFLGNKQEVKYAKNAMLKQFECDDVGFPEEYVGCKLNFDKEENSLTFTQPVMIQSFSDEYEAKECSNDPVTPLEPGRILVSGNECDLVSKVRQTYYRSGVGKLLHMMRWSRPEIQSSVRELARNFQGAVDGHVKAMHRVMLYVISTPNRGLALKPNRVWNGKDRNFEFIMEGRSDSKYVTCPDTRRSVSGGVLC